MRVNRKYLLTLMGLATLVLFPLLAWPLLYVQGLPYFEMFNIDRTAIFLLPIYLAIGIVFGLIVIWFSELPYFESALEQVKSRLEGIKITTFHAIFLSVCAGVGEEVFFRGALQPLVGIWGTAIFFVAIHAYFSFKNLRLNVFGIGLTILIAFLGWSAQNYSLWLAIVAHFSYDLVLLFYFKYEQAKNNEK